MNTQKRCPECKQFLTKNESKCNCGWRGATQSVMQRDWRCEFAIGTRRCPLPGTVCNSPYSDGPWYCSGHSRTVNDDPRLAEAVLLDAENNYDQIMEARRDWRRKLWDIPKVKTNEKK